FKTKVILSSQLRYNKVAKGSTGLIYKTDEDRCVKVIPFEIETVVGYLSELSEEWFKSRVEPMTILLYRNYTVGSQYEELLLKTARESFYSLLKSEGWYTENPLGEKPEICYATLDDPEGYEALEEWQEAQSRTINPENTVVLFRKE